MLMSKLWRVIAGGTIGLGVTFFALFATHVIVRAEPDAPQTTLIIDTCTEANFCAAGFRSRSRRAP